MPCEKKMGFANRRALRFNSALPPARIPVRAVVQTQCNTDYLPTKAGSAAKLIGEKLIQRATSEPDRLIASPPRGTMPESPLKGLRQMRKSTVSRRGLALLVVWKPAGATDRKRKDQRREQKQSAQWWPCPVKGGGGRKRSWYKGD